MLDIPHQFIKSSSIYNEDIDTERNVLITISHITISWRDYIDIGVKRRTEIM